MLRPVVAACAWFGSAAALAGCWVLHPDAARPEGVDTADGEMVGAPLESGWPGVGALTVFYPGQGYAGAFCTATLFHPSWALTAAHCVTDPEIGAAPDPETTWFYVGNDARPTGTYGLPSSGTLYPVQAFYVHPDWSFATLTDDVALVRLAQPATGVTVYPLNTAVLGASYVGTQAFYVGFGVSNGLAHTGGGLKRSGSIEIAAIYSEDYDSYNDGPAICFGDSGGPGLYYSSGLWRVIGVNSSVSSNGDCLGFANHMRVDRYAGWVSGIVGGASSNCQADPSLCLCAAGCQASGSCDDSRCQVLDCADIWSCGDGCYDAGTGTYDQACLNACYLQGTADGRQLYDELVLCIVSACDGITDDTAYQNCIDANCAAALDACFDLAVGTAGCNATWNCITSCPAGDTGCSNGCLDAGSPVALNQLGAVYDCWDAACPTQTGTALFDCLDANCLDPFQVCIGVAGESESCDDWSTWDCQLGLVCLNDGVANACYIRCNPSQPYCPTPGQVCYRWGDATEGYCAPFSASAHCACDAVTNFCDAGCACDLACDPSGAGGAGGAGGGVGGAGGSAAGGAGGGSAAGGAGGGSAAGGAGGGSAAGGAGGGSAADGAGGGSAGAGGAVGGGGGSGATGGGSGGSVAGSGGAGPGGAGGANTGGGGAAGGGNGGNGGNGGAVGGCRLSAAEPTGDLGLLGLAGWGVFGLLRRRRR